MNGITKEIKIIQINPKLRLFLFIIFNWLAFFLPIAVIICLILIPYLNKNSYIFIIFIISIFFYAIFYHFNFIKYGIKYLPKDLCEHYVKKNINQIKKINNFEINSINNLFNITPICNEIYFKQKQKFIELSWLEESNNRLVVNGKINDLDFSWGIVTKMKKNNFNFFLLAILYFNPIIGIFIGLIPNILNTKISFVPASLLWRPKIKKYRKLGGLDLFPYNVAKLNSENYLIFAAKLQKQNDSFTLIPTDNHYQWPTNISETQKQELQDLIKEMSYLPSIYINQDNISIMMKKYHYNEKDNNELQTWELLKQENSNNEIQFNYLNNAIKIYHIFNKSNFEAEKTLFNINKN